MVSAGRVQQPPLGAPRMTLALRLDLALLAVDLILGARAHTHTHAHAGNQSCASVRATPTGSNSLRLVVAQPACGQPAGQAGPKRPVSADRLISASRRARAHPRQRRKSAGARLQRSSGRRASLALEKSCKLRAWPLCLGQLLKSYHDLAGFELYLAARRHRQTRWMDSHRLAGSSCQRCDRPIELYLS